MLMVMVGRSEPVQSLAPALDGSADCAVNTMYPEVCLGSNGYFLVLLRNSESLADQLWGGLRSVGFTNGYHLQIKSMIIINVFNSLHIAS